MTLTRGTPVRIKATYDLYSGHTGVVVEPMDAPSGREIYKVSLSGDELAYYSTELEVVESETGKLSKPHFKKSSWWADLGNALLLRPVYQKPIPEPKPEAHQSHPEIPNGSKVRINSPMRPSLIGLEGTVHGYWPLASSGPHFTVWLPESEYPTTPYGFNRGELTLIQEEGKL